MSFNQILRGCVIESHHFLRVLVCPLDPLDDRRPLLGRVVGVGQEQLRQLPLADPARLRVWLLAGEFQGQDGGLQLRLELKEALDRQFAVEVLA